MFIKMSAKRNEVSSGRSLDEASSEANHSPQKQTASQNPDFQKPCVAP
jgi:hypothetical protein